MEKCCGSLPVLVHSIEDPAVAAFVAAGTWRFMGSYKPGYKFPKRGQNERYLLMTPDDIP